MRGVALMNLIGTQGTSKHWSEHFTARRTGGFFVVNRGGAHGPKQYAWLLKEPGPKMLVEALKHYGVKEIAGARNSPEIMAWADELGGNVRAVYQQDSTPWCGLFVAMLAHRAGKALPGLTTVGAGLGHVGDEIPAATAGRRSGVPAQGRRPCGPLCRGETPRTISSSAATNPMASTSRPAARASCWPLAVSTASRRPPMCAASC